MGVGLDFRRGGLDLVEVALVTFGPASFVSGELARYAYRVRTAATHSSMRTGLVR